MPAMKMILLPPNLNSSCTMVSVGRVAVLEQAESLIFVG
jgi:hypothetical protein